MDQIQWEMEQKHLEKIYSLVISDIEKRQKDVRGYKKSVIKTQRSIWEEGDHTWEYGDTDAAVEVKQAVDALKHEYQKHQIAIKQLYKLERLKRAPYFGRIDFIEEGYKDTEEIYIGITSFFDERGDILIYDWRAPVSSIFYDYELGPAVYKCLDGTVEGQVKLKRQYRISENKLLYMFNTGIKIDDELLQEILSKNTDEKMRNIVNTIQKEQNKIIRDENHQLLMVQGVAGSGKTSIALHRIAYMLYKYRDENMTSSNILIFSPNTVFNDYISNVLPELGEENMQQTTFNEYIEKIAGKGLVYEDSSNHMEYILTADPVAEGPRLSGIAYKSTMDFYKLLNDYAHYLEHETLSFSDLKLKGQILVSAGEIKNLFYEDYGSMPLAKRLEKIKARLLYLIKPVWRQRVKELQEVLIEDPEYRSKAKAYSRLFAFKEFKKLREQIDTMLQFDSYTAFTMLFDDVKLFQVLAKDSLPENYKEICKATATRLRERRLGYEDISAFVYLKGILEGVPTMSHIRHVVVDEAQDYTAVQYGIIKQLFPKTRMTLLGDFNQTINPLKGTFQYDMVMDVLTPASHAVLELNKGYRSTSDIVNFTRCILENGDYIESIQRKGELPRIVRGSSEEELVNTVIADVNKMISEGMESVGIICKTLEKSRWLHSQIRSSLMASLVTGEDTNYSKGIVVLPVYLAKGLEFDGAVVYQADASSYGLDKDRKLFYTACTRALHKLYLYHTGDVTPFVGTTPAEFYKQEIL